MGLVVDESPKPPRMSAWNSCRGQGQISVVRPASHSVQSEEDPRQACQSIITTRSLTPRGPSEFFVIGAPGYAASCFRINTLQDSSETNVNVHRTHHYLGKLD